MTKIRRDLWTQRELPPPRRNPFPDILLPSGIPKAWQKQSSGCQNVPLCATKQAAEVSALTQQKKKKKGGKFKQPIKLLHKFRLDKTPGPYTGTSHRKNSVRGARHGMFFFFFLIFFEEWRNAQRIHFDANPIPRQFTFSQEDNETHKKVPRVTHDSHQPTVLLRCACHCQSSAVLPTVCIVLR